MTSFAHSTWCQFCRISSPAEASLVAEHCLFSLATLEVACMADSVNFALTERERGAVWRWAVISPEGTTMAEGREPTRARARAIAELTIQVVAA